VGTLKFIPAYLYTVSNNMCVFFSNPASQWPCLCRLGTGGFWTSGHTKDPPPALPDKTFVWKVPTPNGYVQQTMDHENWRPGEPNMYPNEPCLATYGDINQWMDVLCWYNYRYLCEYETVMPFGYSGPGDTCSGDSVHLVM